MNLSHIKVLVAEDQVINQFIFKKILNRWDITPTVVDDGEKAVDAINSGSFDIAFLDIQMPYMGGYEAARKIRSTNQDIPLIGISAAMLPGYQDEVKKNGMSSFIGKPYSHEEILEIMKRFIPDLL